MRHDLDAKLCADFPALYRDRHGDRDETRMADGFPGDGWEPLIRKMSEKIEPFCVGTNLRAVQIKQKFGELRVYLEPEPIPDAVNVAIGDAVAESERTCELCGAAGEQRLNRTLCADCAAEGRKA